MIRLIHSNFQHLKLQSFPTKHQLITTPSNQQNHPNQIEITIQNSQIKPAYQTNVNMMKSTSGPAAMTDNNPGALNDAA